MHGSARRTLFALLLAGTVLASAAPAGGSPAQTALGTAPGFDPDTVLLRVDVGADGTATWTVEYRLRLETDNETAAFEDVEEEIAENPNPYLGRFRSVVAPAVGKAENTTGREMEMRNLDVAASRELGPRTGVVTYTFEWTNFAVTEGDRLRVGDALSGFYVGEDTSLLVGWPANYRLVDATPTPHESRERAAVWQGPTAFADTEPRLLLVRTSGTPTPGGKTTEGGPEPGHLVPLLPVTGAGLLALVLVGALAWTARGGERAPEDSDGPKGPPPDLLSNEERLLDALEAAGGRAKQQELADELDWTDPKTSRVVNTLREDDAVEVFRLGRENVVSLPDDEN